MTPEDFVSALQKVVLEASVEATVATLERPPGRRPGQDLIEASAWYHSLSDESRAILCQVLGMTAHQAVFGCLAVLDGSRVIEDDAQKGDFNLIYRKGTEEWSITDSVGPPLHEILNRQDGRK